MDDMVSLGSLADLLLAAPDTDRELVTYHCTSRHTSFSVGDLTTSAIACASALTTAGVRAGSSVVALAGEHPCAIAAMFATWSLGATYVPMQVDAQVHAVLDAIRPSAALIGNLPGRVRPLSLPDGVGIVQVAGDDGLSWDVDVPGEPAGKSAGKFEANPPKPKPGSEIALALDVSNAAISASVVYVTIKQITTALATIEAAVSADEVEGFATRFLSYSLGSWPGILAVLTALRTGTRLFICNPFSPVELRQGLRQFDIRAITLTTSMLAMLVDESDIEDLTPLQIVRYPSPRLPVALARRFATRFGVPVISGYGAAAFGHEVLGWTASDIAKHANNKVGSVGRPLGDTTVRLLDDEAAQLPEGKIGELAITVGSGANTALEVRTGDHAWIDADGFVWIVGRNTDVVEIAGRRVFPDAVEAVLCEEPSVREVSVFGLPRAGNSELWAVVRPRPGVRAGPEVADAVAKFARERLATVEVPERIAIVDVLPRTEAGLPDRRRLADQAAAGALLVLP